MSFDIKGTIALVITVTLSITVIGAVVVLAVTGRTLSPQAEHALSTICGALIGVLSVYIGSKVGDKL